MDWFVCSYKYTDHQLARMSAMRIFSVDFHSSGAFHTQASDVKQIGGLVRLNEGSETKTLHVHMFAHK